MEEEGRERRRKFALQAMRVSPEDKGLGLAWRGFEEVGTRSLGQGCTDE